MCIYVYQSVSPWHAPPNDEALHINILNWQFRDKVASVAHIGTQPVPLTLTL